MAITLQNSTEHAAGVVNQTRKLILHELGGTVKCAFFTHTQAGLGDATSSIALFKLPPGRIRLLASQSKAHFNWTTAVATADLGWDAYTDRDGSAVAADPNGLDDGIDVELAGFQTFGAIVTAAGGTKVFESESGVVIRMTSQDVAIADTNTLVGYMLYVVES